MLKKTQKAWTALVAGTVILFLAPSVAYATETEINQSTPKSLASSLRGQLPLIETKGFVTPDSSLEEHYAEALNITPEAEKIPIREAIVQAALAQVGIHQDCTDLVQNTFAALGMTERRDRGGYDYGTHIGLSFGYEIHWTEAQPGDIAWHPPTDGGHVWVILDPATNTGIHGGLLRATVGGEGTTVVSDYPRDLSSMQVIRIHEP